MINMEIDQVKVAIGSIVVLEIGMGILSWHEEGMNDDKSFIYIFYY